MSGSQIATAVYVLPRAVGASLVVVLLFAAALNVPSSLTADFGPRLQGHVSNFEPRWEVSAGDVVRWSRARSRIDLPFVVTGSMRIELRGSHPAGTATIRVGTDRRALGVARYSKRPRDEAFLNGGPWRRVRLFFRAVDGPAAGRRGFRAHQLRLSLHETWILPSPNVALALGASGFLTFLLFVGLGASAPTALSYLLLLLMVPATAMAAVDPLGAADVSLKLAPWLPVLGAMVSVVLKLLSRASPLKGRLSPETTRVATAIVFAALVLRGGFVLHPGYFYKDTRIHNTVTQIGLSRGVVDQWRNIDRYQQRLDLGTTYVPGGLPIIRYPPTFYTLALVPLRVTAPWVERPAIDYWNRLTAGVASALHAVPIFLILLYIWPRGPAPLFGSLIHLLSPMDYYYLGLAADPATLGKLIDLIVLAFCILFVGRHDKYFLGLVALVSLALLTYPASWSNLGTLIGIYIVIQGLRGRWRPALAVAATGFTALGLAHVLFYGDLLLALALEHVPAGVSQFDAGQRMFELRDLGTWFWPSIRTYFSSFHFGLLLAGLIVYLRSGAPAESKVWIGSWSLTLVALLALRHAGGMVLMYIRPFYFPSSVVPILGGIAVASLWWDGRGRKLVAIAILSAALLIEVVKIHAMIPGYFEDYTGFLYTAWVW